MQYEATASLQVREPASFHLQARETALLHCPRTYVQAPTHTLSLGFSLSRAHTRPLPLSHFFPKIASILSDPPLPTLLSPFLPCLREFTHPASIHRLLCDVAQCNLSATRYIPTNVLLPQHPASSRNEHLSGILQAPSPRGNERTRVHLITLRAHLLVFFVFCFEFDDGFLWRAAIRLSQSPTCGIFRVQTVTLLA
jgi:hypothetical protein